MVLWVILRRKAGWGNYCSDLVCEVRVRGPSNAASSSEKQEKTDYYNNPMKQQ